LKKSYRDWVRRSTYKRKKKNTCCPQNGHEHFSKRLGENNTGIWKNDPRSIISPICILLPRTKNYNYNVSSEEHLKK
jgi:hypothetical protein